MSWLPEAKQELDDLISDLEEQNLAFPDDNYIDPVPSKHAYWSFLGLLKVFNLEYPNLEQPHSIYSDCNGMLHAHWHAGHRFVEMYVGVDERHIYGHFNNGYISAWSKEGSIEEQVNSTADLAKEWLAFRRGDFNYPWVDEAIAKIESDSIYKDHKINKKAKIWAKEFLSKLRDCKVRPIIHVTIRGNLWMRWALDCPERQSSANNISYCERDAELDKGKPIFRKAFDIEKYKQNEWGYWEKFMTEEEFIADVLVHSKEYPS